jgi:hypothetical protein
MDLLRAYESAWDHYQRTWRAVDFELYALCGRRGHQRRDDVYTKVTVINRVYAAGIARTLGAAGEELVADALLAIGDRLRTSLAAIENSDVLNPPLANEIVKAHGSVTGELADRTGGKWLTSFTSKYLHFHRPSFPIFDDRARVALGGWLVASGIRRDREAVEMPARWDRAYFAFVQSFYAIYRKLDEVRRSVPLTVKGVDHLLWRGNVGL